METKVFYCKDFEGHWPVGVSAVVVAYNEESARNLLEKKLISEHGLTGRQPKGNPLTLHEVSLKEEGVIVLQDGNY